MKFMVKDAVVLTVKNSMADGVLHCPNVKLATLVESFGGENTNGHVSYPVSVGLCHFSVGFGSAEYIYNAEL